HSAFFLFPLSKRDQRTSCNSLKSFSSVEWKSGGPKPFLNLSDASTRVIPVIFAYELKNSHEGVTASKARLDLSRMARSSSPISLDNRFLSFVNSSCGETVTPHL